MSQRMSQANGSRRSRVAAVARLLLFGGATAAVLAIGGAQGSGGANDTMFLTDLPGNWFRSETSKTPVAVVNRGGRVDFKINGCCTDTRHTATLLVKPPGSRLALDQDDSKKGTLSAQFDVAGVYVFVCKVHPYMTAVVGVRNASGNIPDVRAAALPFLSHLGLASLSANDTLAVITTIAPDNATKLAKWDIFPPGDPRLVRPPVPGVGEVWVGTQFEKVSGLSKPGTLTVVDAATFRVEREVFGGRDPQASGMWNNPHNMWANFEHDTIYNGNWFGRWVNKIDRATGNVLNSVEVGEAPTHIMTDPNPSSGQMGVLHVPLSADDNIVRLEDRPDGLKIIDSEPTGEGKNHPHGHWLKCGLGEDTIVPNVFKGLGFGGSISVVDTESGDVVREFLWNPNDPLLSALQMPIAAGECHVDLPGGVVHKAYVANVVTGKVTVLDVDAREIIRNIPVTLTPGDERTGFGILDTLQVPIQTPVSPDGKWAATAVLSLTTVDRVTTGAADHVAIIDTTSDQVVSFGGTPAGTHGVNWGAKRGGGYYAYVTNQHANVLTVIDPDPDGDGNGGDAAAVGQIRLANGSPGAGATDGTGGQGVKPLPMTHDGWIQPAVALVGTGRLSAEVEGWIGLLTAEQKNPGHH